MKIETMQDLRCQLKSLKDDILESISDAPPDAHLVVEDLLEFDLPKLDAIVQALQGKALVHEKDLQSAEYWKTQAMHLSDLAYKYESALCRISRPIVAMQKDAAEEGAILDGFMAQNLARDGHMLSEWARQALQASQEKDN